MHIEIVTPRGLVFRGEVDEVTVPGAVGELGLLPGHIPIITALDVGEMVLRSGGHTEYLAVEGGFLEIARDRINVVTERALRPDEIDVEAAQQRLHDADAALREAAQAGSEQCARVLRDLRRAEAHVRVARHAG